jgi:tRNA-2-methylthio-N6-dimethylallyladenosine synthase
VKGRRLAEIIDAQKAASAERMRGYVGQVHEVLVEGVSKRSADHVFGRNSQNSIVILPRYTDGGELTPGTFVHAHIESATPGSLKGRIVPRVTKATVTA